MPFSLCNLYICTSLGFVLASIFLETCDKIVKHKIRYHLLFTYDYQNLITTETYFCFSYIIILCGCNGIIQHPRQQICKSCDF